MRFGVRLAGQDLEQVRTQRRPASETTDAVDPAVWRAVCDALGLAEPVEDPARFIDALSDIRGWSPPRVLALATWRVLLSDDEFGLPAPLQDLVLRKFFAGLLDSYSTDRARHRTRASLLAARCFERGWTQEELANEAGIDVETLQDVVRNQGMPQRPESRALCAALDISPADWDSLLVDEWLHRFDADIRDRTAWQEDAGPIVALVQAEARASVAEAANAADGRAWVLAMLDFALFRDRLVQLVSSNQEDSDIIRNASRGAIEAVLARRTGMSRGTHGFCSGGCGRISQSRGCAQCCRTGWGSGGVRAGSSRSRRWLCGNWSVFSRRRRWRTMQRFRRRCRSRVV